MAARQGLAGCTGLAVAAIGQAVKDHRAGDVVAGLWLAASGWLRELADEFDMPFPALEVNVDRDDIKKWFARLPSNERQAWADSIHVAMEVIHMDEIRMHKADQESLAALAVLLGELSDELIERGMPILAARAVAFAADIEGALEDAGSSSIPPTSEIVPVEAFPVSTPFPPTEAELQANRTRHEIMASMQGQVGDCCGEVEPYPVPVFQGGRDE